MKNILYLLAFSLFLCTFNAKAQTVSVHEFEKRLEERLEENTDVQLLDVRTVQEFNSGHLADALWADWRDSEEFERRIDALDKNKPVYIYCLSGGRSAAAHKAMKEKGFKNIVELQGGINAWKQADKDLVGKQDVEQMGDQTYTAMLASAKVVLVDFGADWCPPCKKMNPVIAEIEKENENKMALVNIDGGSQDYLMKTHEIKHMPTLILYKDGKEVWRASGILAKEEIQKALDAVY